MNNSIFRFVAVLLALFFIGHGTAQEISPPEIHRYLATFTNVHSRYCEQAQINADSLRNKLDADDRLFLSTEYEDVYELIVHGLSYAVTPQEDGCTTDVMLSHKGKPDPIMTLNERDSALVARGYNKVEEKVLYEDDLDGNEIRIIDIEYSTPNEERAVLSYPLENQDNFYMTLWVEKFKDSVNKSLKAGAPGIGVQDALAEQSSSREPAALLCLNEYFTKLNFPGPLVPLGGRQGQWELAMEPSMVDDSITFYACLPSESAAEGELERETPSLFVICGIGVIDVAAIVTVDYGVQNDIPVVTRFDGAEPEKSTWRISPDKKAIIAPVTGGEFSKKLMSKTVLSVQLTLANQELVEFTYDLRGTSAALNTLRQACQWE